MKNRQYQGVQLSKKESELIQWLQKGEHTWRDAFYEYADRKRSGKIGGLALKERSWFNTTLASLRKKGLCKNIPFIYHNIPWRNPGITANKANFSAITLQETNLQNTQELRHVI